ncbi:MAG: hypothetical protein ACM3PP_12330 [Candidatus Saccharibacteria bacterium]
MPRSAADKKNPTKKSKRGTKAAKLPVAFASYNNGRFKMFISDTVDAEQRKDLEKNISSCRGDFKMAQNWARMNGKQLVSAGATFYSDGTADMWMGTRVDPRRGKTKTKEEQTSGTHELIGFYDKYRYHVYDIADENLDQ